MTFASAVTRRVTRQPLLWVALTLSLVLNLCFIAGAAWIHIHAPSLPMTPEERFQRIGAELALDPQQQQAFDRYTEAVRIHMQRMREAVDPLMSAARTELAKPNADEATVVRLVDAKLEANRRAVSVNEADAGVKEAQRAKRSA